MMLIFLPLLVPAGRQSEFFNSIQEFCTALGTVMMGTDNVSRVSMARKLAWRVKLMPVAQFNQFEKLDNPIMQAGGEAAAYKFWHQLSNERNSYLDGVDTALIGQPTGERP